ncbi:type II secretion system major pseudopilin GspG [Stakelama tenebrarum]|uniref:Type II secretion system core protein G n=1 Tax=Stakelama tenebrarum TaxID=2711215 RepID=A0A6G6Y4G9_9SPHN|nr:type II secretion system major pseudopilin GspG [Sphingosinithalassobacter tenebrarum]QIG79741.1 type II secretion system major pseudopilin GspG [Sphingosinithalassobacter tenebrarum]
MRIVFQQFCDSLTVRPADRKRPAPGETGLTLIEMLVVLVIIAIVGGMIAMNVIDRPDEARVTTTKTNISAISGALKLYRLDNGVYPTTQQGLQALVEKPSTPPVPTAWSSGGYLDSPPLDAWGNPYVYTNEGARFSLKSLGRDGEPGGEGVDADIEG